MEPIKRSVQYSASVRFRFGFLRMFYYSTFTKFSDATTMLQRIVHCTSVLLFLIFILGNVRMYTVFCFLYRRNVCAASSIE